MTRGLGWAYDAPMTATHTPRQSHRQPTRRQRIVGILFLAVMAVIALLLTQGVDAYNLVDWATGNDDQSTPDVRSVYTAGPGSLEVGDDVVEGTSRFVAATDRGADGNACVIYSVGMDPSEDQLVAWSDIAGYSTTVGLEQGRAYFTNCQWTVVSPR